MQKFQMINLSDLKSFERKFITENMYINIMEDFWLDSFEMKEKFPDIINLPTKGEIEFLDTRDYVKIANNRQFIWVEIKYINPEHNVFTGRIINRRILNKPYKRGDIIRFEDNNILQIISI